MISKPAKIFASLVFITLLSSCSASYLEVGAFYEREKVEQEGDSNFLVKKDGSKVFGKVINWKVQTIGDGSVTIDGNKFKLSDIKGFQKDRVYYANLKSRAIIRRVVRGKINVYLNPIGSRSETYAQKGEDGEFIRLKSQQQAAEMLSDCPAAAEMINISNGQLRRAVKSDAHFLNEAFEMYNNDCKPTNHPRAKYY